MRVLAFLIFCVSLVFANPINLQTASKDELMSVKGIGAKKADQIIEYRKTNKITNPEDLKNIKGFGDNIVTNVKENKQKASKTKSAAKKVPEVPVKK